MVEPRRLPSLLSIRAFEAAARTGSFAAAARELGTTAAAVSYHVRQLERQSGLSLFRRHPHRVELTEPGAAVAHETLKAFEALRACFGRAVELEQGRLSLSCLPTFGAAWLAPRLGDFRARHPGVRLEVDLSAEVRDLAGGGFDLAIRNGDGDWPGLRAVKLFPAVFMPLCAPALLDRASGTGPVDDPAIPLLGRPDWWALWFRGRGQGAVPLERFGLALAEEHLDAAAAVAGHGVAIGSPILFARDLEAGRLVPAHPLVAADGRAFWLTYPVARQQSAKIRLFRDWLCGEADSARATARPWIEAAVGL